MVLAATGRVDVWINWPLNTFLGLTSTWWPRELPVICSDLRRGLHLILRVCLGWEIEVAIRYNPHCFRHFLIESGQQLRSLKVCSTDDMERLGRWTKGSSMPDAYDNASGVSELMARHTVVQALKSGWRPVAEGHLPNQVSSSSSSSSSLVYVGHKVSKKVHVHKRGTRRTSCGMWTCGTPDFPAKQAEFVDISSTWERCKQCGA